MGRVYHLLHHARANKGALVYAENECEAWEKSGISLSDAQFYYFTDITEALIALHDEMQEARFKRALSPEFHNPFSSPSDAEEVRKRIVNFLGTERFVISERMEDTDNSMTISFRDLMPKKDLKS